MEESCKTCRFYQPHKKGNGADLEVGFCRRYAPRHVSGVGTGYEEILWPTVTEDDWCGEYEMWRRRLVLQTTRQVCSRRRR